MINIAITSNIAINLGTTYLAKKLSVVSTVPYTIVVPADVDALQWNTTTSVTKTVPADMAWNCGRLKARADSHRFANL